MHGPASYTVTGPAGFIVVAPMILVSVPIPGTNWVFEPGWTGLMLGFGGLGTKGLGKGLDNH